MKLIRTAAILAALASFAVTGVAHAAPRHDKAETTKLRRDAAAEAKAYHDWVYERTRASEIRIAGKLRTMRMTADRRDQILHDVAYSASLLRQRADLYAQDGRITDNERTNMQNLAAAIQAELAGNYGTLDSWQLL